MLLLSNYGFAGLLLFGIFAGFIVKSYFCNREKDIFVRVSAGCLLSIGVFALFSYPLRYPFIWVTVLLSMAVIIGGAGYKVKIAKGLSVLLKTTSALLIVAITTVTGFKMASEIKWCKTAHISLLGKTEQILPVYKTLYSQLHNNELFLYNYSAELNVAGRYEESLQIAQECERVWADYDLQMLMGDNYEQTEQFDEVELHYKKASRMCPVKFMPLYKLYKLYEHTNETEKMLAMAELIHDKPVKIMSSTVLQIKNEIQGILNQYDDATKEFNYKC